MCKKCFLTLIGILFSIKVVFILFIWVTNGALTATLNGWMMPQWLFVLAIIIDALLAIWAFKLTTHCNPEYWEKKKGKKK